MIDFKIFYKQIAIGQLSKWLEILPKQIITWQKKNIHGNFNSWVKIIENLPVLIPEKLDLVYSVSAEQKDTLSKFQRKNIEKSLLKLIPWRKGPYSLYGIKLDAEWQSNWKWQRVSPHISPLFNRTVLDVGCGNGYYMWRMIGAGAKLVVGIDPIQLYLCQFEVVRKLLGNDRRCHLLPIGIEQVPALQAFDTVFSMGVLYHRRSPLDHLIDLKNQLVTNGELVLETLIIDSKNYEVLVPTKSYAKMQNVYSIPSVSILKNWLKKCGFVDIRIIDTCFTSVEEQRRTKWINSESLADFLDPKDRNKTVEGYPAPLRVVLVMRKP